MIITVGRECGSGGHQIGEMLAEHYGIKCYDRHILVANAKKSGKYDELESFFSEQPLNSLLYSIAINESEVKSGDRTLNNFKSLIDDESFVLIGRCGNYMFKDSDDEVSIFITADKETKIDKTIRKQSIDRIKANELIDYVDGKRMEFHKHYTGEEWGNARNYDLCINSSKLGIDKTVESIIKFIDEIK